MPDYETLVASKAIPSNTEVNSSKSLPVNEGGDTQQMTMIEGKGIPGLGGDVTENFRPANVNMVFGKLNEGGGPLGAILTEVGGKMTNYFVGQEAQGDNMKLEEMGKGERQAPPTFQGDAQIKNVGMIGGEGQSM